MLTIGSSDISVSIREIPFSNLKPISPRINGRLIVPAKESRDDEREAGSNRNIVLNKSTKMKQLNF